MVVENYRGIKVITGAGIVFLFACLLSSIILLLHEPSIDICVFIIVSTLVSLLGIMDDYLGDNNAKGIKGHINTILRGEMSTGAIKAILGIFTGLIVSIIYYDRIFEIIINTSIFALCINFFNLLDLRPGRTIKTFIMSIVLFLFFNNSDFIWMFYPMLGVLSVYIFGEMREVYMLGDSGANLIGGIMGLFIIRSMTTNWKIIILSFLIIIHLFAEFNSISACIKKNPILRFIDNIGRIRS